MRSLLFVLLVALSSSFLSCDRKPGHCGSNSDCPAGFLCSFQNQCVQCVNNNNCDEDEFCCRGKCKFKAQINKFCGCDPAIDGQSGLNCQSLFVLGSERALGPMCLVDGDNPNLTNVASASCGCLTTEGGECGESPSGLKGLCVNAQCIEQSSQNCGLLAQKCTPSNGGGLCLPSASELGYGKCGCDVNQLDSSCKVSLAGHVVADACESQVCVCGSNSPCEQQGKNPDCCTGSCVDILVSDQNCGACGRSCGDNSCVRGVCGCKAKADCQSSRTDQCAHVDSIDRLRGEGSFTGLLCVCSNFQDQKGNLAPCAIGEHCCQQGCCTKPCAEAGATDCRAS